MLIRTTSGISKEMEIPAPAPGRESVFVFALHKSGSVLLDNIVRDLCASAKIPVISIDLFCFNKGLPIELVTADSVEGLFDAPGYCFSGFRGVHPCLDRVDLSRYRKVVLVRDPRDILTSFYFSMAKSHAVPEEGEMRDRMLAIREQANLTLIDRYVLSPQVDFIARNYRRFIRLEGETTKVYRYEDVIFDKENWVKSLAQWLSLDVAETEIKRIADKHDIRPNDENPERHIRQVVPGNHRKHLAPETIQALNERYADVMAHFRYPGE
jgi:hypothetical protein